MNFYLTLLFCPWIITLISPGRLTRPQGIYAFMRVASILTGSISTEQHVGTEIWQGFFCCFVFLFPVFSEQNTMSVKTACFHTQIPFHSCLFWKATCDAMLFIRICAKRVDMASVENCLCVLIDPLWARSPHEPPVQTQTLTRTAVD